MSASGQAWFELRPDNSLEEITLSVRPKLSWLPVGGLNLSAYVEPALVSSGQTRVEQLVGGALMAWEFAPKSWFYLVYNHGMERGASGALATTGSELQAKVKYLFLM